MPKVSIVLPTYNGEEYLRESVESIISQSFTDWELIIVDDCSTDSTPRIAEEYAAKDCRIRVIHNEVNKKLPCSLNVGFRSACGDYLTWTSDDNKYLPNAIDRMVNYLDNNTNEYMVCAKMNIISENGEFIQVGKSYSNKMMVYANCLGACFLYRKSVINDIGEYNPDFFLVEDYEYWLRILYKYGNIGFIDEVLYLYRRHSKSLTGTRRKDILYNDSRLKFSYVDNIISVLSDRKDLLCATYYRMHFYFSDDKKITELFSEYVPEIKIDIGHEVNGMFIVYGAGKIGKEFAAKYGEHIHCFVDKNDSISGCFIGDKIIKPISELNVLKNDYPIMIAAGADNIYDFLCTLKNMGIEQCYVYKPE